MLIKLVKLWIYTLSRVLCVPELQSLAAWLAVVTVILEMSVVTQSNVGQVILCGINIVLVLVSVGINI